MLHAVALLRSAIPAQATQLHISFSNGRIENRKHGLSEVQLAAAIMLIGVATYHYDLMIAAYGELNKQAQQAPQALRLARQAFATDVRRKLNVIMQGYVVDSDWDGSITVTADTSALPAQCLRYPPADPEK